MIPWSLITSGAWYVILYNLLYTIFIYIPLWILNFIYTLFKSLGGGIFTNIFHTTIVNGHLTWQFSWGGQIATVLICLIFVMAIIWLFYLIIKINRKNAQRKLGGNPNERIEHLKMLIGFPLFVFLSPFVLMIVSTLLSMLVSIFQQNNPTTLSGPEIAGLKNYMLADMNSLKLLQSVTISIDGGPSMSLGQCLQELHGDITQAIADATSHGNTKLVDILNDEQKWIDLLSSYINGGINVDTTSLQTLIWTLQPGEISWDAANQFSTILGHIGSINNNFANAFNAFKDLSPYQSDLANWGDGNIFPIMNGIKDSFGRTSGSFMYIGDFTTSGGLLDAIVWGDKNQIGLDALVMRLTGMVEFNLVGQIYQFVTGDTNQARWNVDRVDLGGIGIVNFVFGAVFLWMTLGVMFAGLMRVAICWVTIIPYKWFGTVGAIAKGDNNGLSEHMQSTLSVWLEILFTYMYFELACAFMPIFTQSLSGENTTMQALSLVVIDALLVVCFVRARTDSQRFGMNDAQYYLQNGSQTMNASKTMSNSPGGQVAKSGGSVSKKAGGLPARFSKWSNSFKKSVDKG